MKKTNKNGSQINILLIQGCIVTVLSSLYIVMKDVSVAFFLLSALTIGLYLIMYMLMYAAGIRLRYTQPQLPRSYRVPGGNAGMWIIGGGGFLAVLFAFTVTFFPPSQLPVGSPKMCIRDRFGPEDTGFQAELLPGNPGLGHRFGQVKGV